MQYVNSVKTQWDNIVGAMNKPDYDTLFIPWEDWQVVVMEKRNVSSHIKASLQHDIAVGFYI